MNTPSDLALPPLTLHEICEEDALDVLEFESSNSTFFEKWVPARGPEHFEEESLKQVIRDLMTDPDRFYLMRSEAGELVGRINLRNLGKEPLNTAELGYRVGEKHLGKGYAKAAVVAVADLVRAQGDLSELEAFAADNNPASSNVLRACGFRWDKDGTKTVHLNGNPLTLHRFTLTL
ncbi:GNAT family N-acetyltransferase [Pseudovibrio brasiliensis]|uniref:GNAT family N-acetyltransferase n=1 Tax=Pseudovibrio brasiliensis TaxID=1898042 RepID=A0ABX8AUX1_9HYPH|nr:GNAT family protein [Pseudovibrio brasiliensis]QUS58880.1 GNAT family N-acetyltransferase [Pseudovibrio brasiliensis]